MCNLSPLYAAKIFPDPGINDLIGVNADVAVQRANKAALVNNDICRITGQPANNNICQGIKITGVVNIVTGNKRRVSGKHQ